MIDTIAENGIRHINDVPYKGNFTISFHSKTELLILQNFFNVRSNKFDMRLLEKRPELLLELIRDKDENTNN